MRINPCNNVKLLMASWVTKLAHNMELSMKERSYNSNNHHVALQLLRLYHHH